MTDISNLRGVARPAAHLKGALRLLHPNAHAIPLADALDDAKDVTALAEILDTSIGASVRTDGTIDLHLLAAHVLRATRETKPMNQDRVNKLAAEHYVPLYKEHAEHPDVKAAAKKIVAEERAKGNDDLQTSRAIRTRIHELLQSLVDVPDPEMTPSSKASEMRAQLEEHHNHQTAHFTALWQHTEALAAQAMGAS